MKEPIRMKDGTIVHAEVTGKTLDGQQGSFLLTPEGANSLEKWLTSSKPVEVKRNDKGQWVEVEAQMSNEFNPIPPETVESERDTSMKANTVQSSNISN